MNRRAQHKMPLLHCSTRKEPMPKLLIIDDEPNIRFSIQEVFEGEDTRVLAAATADDGLRIASEEVPDVILLDVRLGDRSGLDVFEDLKKIDRKCLVVFITGHGTADTAIEAMKLGAYDYLVKPLDVAQLQQVVSQAFQISQLMHVPAVVADSVRPDIQVD